MAIDWNKKVDLGIVELKRKHLLALAVTIFLVGSSGIAVIPGIPQNETVVNIWEQVQDYWDPEESKDKDDAITVDQVKMEVAEGIDTETSGLGAGTAANIAVRVHHDSGGKPGAYFKSVTASSGIITLYNVPSGVDIWVQARQGAPAAADPYISPMVKRSVPSFSEIGNDDVVYLDALYVRDVTGTAPTLEVRDGSGNAISDNSANYFNLTDTTFTVELDTIDADTWYGGQNADGLSYILDYATGEMYAYGVFFVWKGTKAQPFNTHDYIIPFDGTNIYYIWNLAPYLVDDSTAGVATDVLSKILQTDGSNLVADTTVVLDVNDMIQVGTDGELDTLLSSADLIDGGGVAVTAITTKTA
jgi:hypothetical protein